MKFCNNCGNQINADSAFCSMCGCNVYKASNDSSATVVICAVIGLLFPIIGAILYYVFKNSNIRAAKTANVCSWIGFLSQLMFYLLGGFFIFSFL